MHQRIDTEGLDFQPILEDVSALNSMAFKRQLAVTKLSYHAFGYLTDHYALLRAGSALGRNCGPLLLAKEKLEEEKIISSKCAIPGRYTTANFLLGLAYPGLQNKEERIFHEIEEAVLQGDCETGLIIHENRFTYAEKGLVKLLDLGVYWEQSTGYAIPLGGIVVRRDIEEAIQKRIERVIARSVAYAFAHPTASAAYVAAHAQAMDPAVRQAHIGLYVNDFSLDLGEEGIAAVQYLLQKGRDLGLLPPGRADFLV